jgi:ketosteroid isomerase-like protein
MNDNDFEKRLDRVESRTAIVEMCTAYGIACDFRDMRKLASLFTDDVVIRSVNGSMNARGIDAAIAMFNRMFMIRGPAYHWTHDRIVIFDDADRDAAQGIILSHAETTPNGIPSLAGLRYHDRYRRIAGRWYFAERLLSFLYYVPLTEYVQRLPESARVSANGQWHAADYPESDAAWREWHAAHRPE